MPAEGLTFPIAHGDRDDETIAAERFDVSLDGWEGPLDLLLALARTQKVDLRKISVLMLAEQYLAYVAEADRLRLELAADYLVMAAWLAWLKSRLLLPPPHPEDEPDPEELADLLAFRLERLEAMRKAAAELFSRDQLGRDIFARGMPERTVVTRETEWQASLSDLLRAYGAVRTRDDYRPLQVERDAVFAIDKALELIGRLTGTALDWADLQSFLPEGWGSTGRRRRSAVASSFAAALELAKRGRIELKQAEPFAPIYLRARAT